MNHQDPPDDHRFAALAALGVPLPFVLIAQQSQNQYMALRQLLIKAKTI